MRPRRRWRADSFFAGFPAVNRPGGGLYGGEIHKVLDQSRAGMGCDGLADTPISCFASGLTVVVRDVETDVFSEDKATKREGRLEIKMR